MLKATLSEEDFNGIYKLYSQYVFNMSYSYLRDYQDAEDVTSEVFLRFLKGFSDYGNKQHEKNFLLRTAINLSIDILRKQKKKEAYVASQEEPKGEEIDEKDEELFNLVAELPSKYKNVIVMFFYDEMSVEEIASFMRISKSAVLKRLQRGRDMLKLEVKD